MPPLRTWPPRAVLGTLQPCRLVLPGAGLLVLHLALVLPGALGGVVVVPAHRRLQGLKAVLPMRGGTRGAGRALAVVSRGGCLGVGALGVARGGRGLQAAVAARLGVVGAGGDIGGPGEKGGGRRAVVGRGEVVPAQAGRAVGESGGGGGGGGEVRDLPGWQVGAACPWVKPRGWGSGSAVPGVPGEPTAQLGQARVVGVARGGGELLPGGSGGGLCVELQPGEGGGGLRLLGLGGGRGLAPGLDHPGARLGLESLGVVSLL